MPAQAAATSASPGSFESTSSTDPSPPRPHTRLRSGIVKPKKFIEGTIRYANFCSTGEPQSLQEAMSDPKWTQAMQDEYDALRNNRTWHLVPLEKGKNLIDCKWVYN